jgi:hypothetical protein
MAKATSEMEVAFAVNRVWVVEPDPPMETADRA